MVVHGRISIMLPGGGSRLDGNHDRLEIVPSLIQAEADPTSIAAGYKGAHSPLANALDQCETYVGHDDLYRVRLRVEGKCSLVCVAHFD